jgi:ATP adenylyltransferase/5',5'''-P-1,P-4-tetraphosphate phosphorylase II
MQLMPMPQQSFASFLDCEDDTKEPAVPFCWFYHRFESHGQFTTPVDVVKVYVDLLEQATRVGAGRSQHAIAPGAACPHNMILTRRWMIVLPRRQAAINKEAGANAMGMLGVIAVGTRKEMDGWVRLGLTDGLRLLGVPK